MVAPLIEVPSGTVNGLNREFRLGTDYRPGSTRVFLNGVLQEDDLQDGWTELGGKRIRMNEPPQPGDTIQVYYIPIL